MADDNDDYDLSKSIDGLRGAGANLNEAIEHLYYGTRKKVKDLHPVLQIGIAVVVWFGGNWIYNRVKTPVLDVTIDVVEAIPAKSLIAPAFGLAEAVAIPVWVQLLGMLSGIILTQNRIHTQKLKEIEEGLRTMGDDPPTATDGGTRKTQKPSGPGVGGAIAGGFAGASFGPGGVLAGAFLGYLISEELIEEDTDENAIDDDIDPFLKNGRQE